MVPAGGVDGDARGLVNHNDIVVFVDDSNLVAGDGGFMAVEGMRDDFAVLDDGVGGRDFAVDGDLAIRKGLYLMSLAAFNLIHCLRDPRSTRPADL